MTFSSNLYYNGKIIHQIGPGVETQRRHPCWAELGNSSCTVYFGKRKYENSYSTTHFLMTVLLLTWELPYLGKMVFILSTFPAKLLIALTPNLVDAFIFGLSGLTHWDREKMVNIFQMTISNAFSWKKICTLWLRFNSILFPRVQLTIFQHGFR